jgi:hypothetical protein
MKTLVRTVLLFTVLAGTFSLGTRPAWACSCAPLNARQTLAETDAAFVGELVARQDPVMLGPVVGPGTSVFTFRVSRAFKGDLGAFVQVESESQGEACGLEVSQGDRTGLFLEKQQDGWRSSLCLQVEPRALNAAARSAGAGEGAKPPADAATAPTDDAADAAPASDARRQGSPVWPWVLVASAAALGSIAFFALRARRSASR